MLTETTAAVCGGNGWPAKVVDAGNEPITTIFPTCSMCGMPQLLDASPRAQEIIAKAAALSAEGREVITRLAALLAASRDDKSNRADVVITSEAAPLIDQNCGLVGADGSARMCACGRLRCRAACCELFCYDVCGSGGAEWSRSCPALSPSFATRDLSFIVEPEPRDA